MVKNALIAGFTLLAASSPAFADAGFSQSTTLATSTLASTISNVSTTFDQGSVTNIGGNQLSGNVGGGSVGVISIVQNTGANTNVQQAVTVSIGSLTVGGTQLLSH